MKFRIKKIVYDNGEIKYYPMVKKGFFGKWYYISKDAIGFSISLGNNKMNSDKEDLIRNICDEYKKYIHKPKPIKVEHILID